MNNLGFIVIPTIVIVVISFYYHQHEGNQTTHYYDLDKAVASADVVYHLDLDDCVPCLENTPNEALSKMPNIQSFEATGLYWTAIDSQVFKAWTDLKELHLKEHYLSELPSTIGDCRALEIVDLSNNKYLRKLPPHLDWVAIKELDLSSTAIEYLPAYFENFTQLEKLDVQSCKQLDIAKSTFPTQLKELRISRSGYSEQELQLLQERLPTTTIRF